MKQPPLLQLHRAVSARGFRSVIFSGLLALGLGSCQQSSTTSDLNMPQLPSNPMVVPIDFPKPVVPADNPMSPAKVELGRALFYDKHLSRDNTVACASCHSLAASFSDPGNAVSLGVRNGRGSRNAPALMNVAYDTTFFWDGRITTLEAQAVAPILNPIELGNDSMTVVNALNTIPYYQRMFPTAFDGGGITFARIGQAIASFERTLISGESDYDRFNRGDKTALSASAQRGLALFKSKDIKCDGCHGGPTFSDNSYRSTGLDESYADQGRGIITKNPKDAGKFKVPALRNIALTSPYMHDGRFTTLNQVLQHYNEGGKHNSTQDSLIHKLQLTDAQINDIIEFLNSLTDRNFTKNQAFAKPNY